MNEAEKFAADFKANLKKAQDDFAKSREEVQEIKNRMTRWQRRQYRALVVILAKQGIPENRIEKKHIEPLLQLKHGETNL